MSASREKKQRQNDPDQGLTQKQRQERAEQQAAKRRGTLYAVLGVVIAVLVVILLVWNSGILQRGTTAASVGGRDYNVTDVAYYYYAAMNQESQNYLSSFNPQEDARTQYVDEAQTQSYYDKFLNEAMESMASVAALENAAAADGYTLTAEDRQEVEDNIASMKSAARQYGYDYSGFLKANYGRYMTPSAYKTCLERNALVNGYSMSIRAAQEVTESELEAYYKENAASLDSYDYRTIYVDGTAPSATDADGNTVEPTEEERTAALQAAKAQADRFAALVEEAADKEAEFIKLAPDYVTESRKANYEEDPDYSLAKGINGGNLSSNAMYYGLTYATWLMEDGRKAGDVTVVESSSGYYVVLFLDRYLEEGNTANIRHILVKAELTQEDDASTEDVDESRIPSQEALDAAKTEIDSLLAQWEGGAKTAESFGALALEHSDDSGSASNGGLMENVYPGATFPAFNDWCMDSARQPGDTTVVENPQEGQQGWHLIYFDSWQPPLWKVTADTALRNDKMTDWMDSLVEGLETTRGDGAQYVG